MTAYRKALFFSCILPVFCAGCGKKEEPKTGDYFREAASPRKATEVVVPDVVRHGWKAVVVSVKNKETGKETAFTVSIGSHLSVPESNMVVRVEAFLPDFTREGTTLTSKSNQPKNPAAQVVVLEGGKEIFKGWLFSQYPTMHAFQHPTYGFTLVDFVSQ